jgi:hypothetical protein
MASDFPAFVARNHDDYDVGQFAIDSANAGKAGSLCFLNTGDNEIEECGADPALILGLMTGPFSARAIYPSQKMPVIILSPDVIVGLCSATTPADSHLTDAYGIVKLASGNWALDTSETVNTRVTVVGVDVNAGIFYVKFLAGNLQGDSIVS